MQKWAAEEGKKDGRKEGRWEETEGRIRVAGRNGEDRFVRTKAGGVQGVKKCRSKSSFVYTASTSLWLCVYRGMEQIVRMFEPVRG